VPHSTPLALIQTPGYASGIGTATKGNFTHLPLTENGDRDHQDRFLSDRYLYYGTVVLSVCLSVTLMYCDQTVGWIKMPLGTEVGLGPGDTVLDGNPAPPAERGTAPPQLFGPCLLWPNGHPYQQLLSSR